MTKPKETRHEATRAAETAEDLTRKATEKVLERSSRQHAAKKSSKVGKNALVAPAKSEPAFGKKSAIDSAVSRLAARAPRFSIKVHPPEAGSA